MQHKKIIKVLSFESLLSLFSFIDVKFIYFSLVINLFYFSFEVAVEAGTVVINFLNFEQK